MTFTIGALTNGVLADPGEYGDHMSWGAGWMWLWGFLMMAAVIALVVWLIRAGTAPHDSSASRGRNADPTERAREILSERYARGDITTEEYRERMAELS